MKKEIKNALIIFIGGIIMLSGVYFMTQLGFYGYGWVSVVWIVLGVLVFVYGLVEDLR